jgi:hypothetical protein
MNLLSPTLKPGIFCCMLLLIGLVLIITPVTAACAPGYHSCGGRCVACPSGSILGSDCKCHQECGDSGHYCTSGRCCGDRCVACPSGSILGTDCLCHKPCGSSGLYCKSGSCCNDRCVSCSSGYLGTDCKCHSQVSNPVTNQITSQITQRVTNQVTTTNDISDSTSSDDLDAGDATKLGKIGLFLAKIVKAIVKII